jgi:hypothetical protein
VRGLWKGLADAEDGAVVRAVAGMAAGVAGVGAEVAVVVDAAAAAAYGLPASGAHPR